MSSPRRVGNRRFTGGAIVGILVCVLAMACLVTFLVTDHNAFLAAGMVLMIAGQVTLAVHRFGRHVSSKHDG